MNMEELHSHQVQVISSVAGGPVEYMGEDMREAHAHLTIEDTDFNAVADHLITPLQENGIRDENVEIIMTEVETLREPTFDQ